MREVAPVRFTALLAGDLAVLVAARPDIARLAADLRDPYAWVARAGTDGAAAGLAQLGLWLCSAWVLVALLTVAGGRLPGAAGKLSSAVAGRTVPGLLRRAVAGSIGMSVLMAPLAACASPNHVGPPLAGTSSVSTTSVGIASAGSSSAGSSFAGSPSAASPSAGRAARAVGAWPWPSNRASSPASGGQGSRLGRMRRPAAAHALDDGAVPWPSSPPTRSGSNPKAPVSEPSETARGAAVVVRPGDCLWAIAAHRLGAHHSPEQIAAETRRWYAANAATIGSDPGLIRPGQQLNRPHEKGAM